MWTRSELKANAKVSLKRNYWGAVLAAFVGGLFAAGSAGSSGSAEDSSGNNVFKQLFSGMSVNQILAVLAVALGVFALAAIISFVVKILVANPLEVGVDRFFIRCKVEEKTSVKELLFGFKNAYGNILKCLFLRDLFIFLWTLLLIVPGIIKSFEYLMVPYIMAENPAMDAKEARELSKRMMDGNKWNAFVLEISFIGWYALAAITCGIVGVFYTNPYVRMTLGELYYALKENRVDM